MSDIIEKHAPIYYNRWYLNSSCETLEDFKIMGDTIGYKSFEARLLYYSIIFDVLNSIPFVKKIFKYVNIEKLLIDANTQNKIINFKTWDVV
jgi:hypothetical protein